MRPLAGCLLLLVLVLAGCGSAARHPQAAPSTTKAQPSARVQAASVARCAAGSLQPLGSAKVAYAVLAPHGAAALRAPGGALIRRFGPANANDYPTLFGVLGAVVRADCTPSWYRVQLPIKPNGAVGYVRAASVVLRTSPTRIVVSLSHRRITVYEHGKQAFSATVGVGSPSTPTPTGRYYVNQRLVPTDPAGPYGPVAIGISAYSNVLTGWTQGGPIAIHGTDEPESIGEAVSNGCVRMPNATLERVFKVAYAGTPVIITP